MEMMLDKNTIQGIYEVLVGNSDDRVEVNKNLDKFIQILDLLEKRGYKNAK